MAAEKTVGDLSAVVETSLPRIVYIRPGSASEKALPVYIPEGMEAPTVEEVIHMALNDTELSRKEERVLERVRAEMATAYGLTLGGDPAQPGTRVTEAHYRPAVSDEGVQYRRAEIGIASDEKGGAYYRLSA